MRAAAVAILALAALALPGAAQAEITVVAMNHATFTPASVQLLAGDVVSWRNISLREHDIRSDAGGFDSGRVGNGGVFGHPFDVVGSYPYACTIHPGMVGDVGVFSLLLDGPRRPVAKGAPLALHVRPAAGVGPVTIEQDTGAGFRPVADAAPRTGGHGGHDQAAEDGYTLHATLTARASATYRAVAGGQVSPTLGVEVSDAPRLAVTASPRRGAALVRVRGVPARPGALVALQLRLRERFGWWTVDRTRLDRRSRARFVVRRRLRVRARVVVLGRDRASVLARSAPVTLRPAAGAR